MLVVVVMAPSRTTPSGSCYGSSPPRSASGMPTGCPCRCTFHSFADAHDIELLGDQQLAGIVDAVSGHTTALFTTGNVKRDIIKLCHRPHPVA